MKSDLYIHPLPVRLWHWINAIGFVTMILSGTQIRYIDLVQIVPFRTAVTLHNWVGFVLIGNYFLWLLFYLFTDKIRVYHPELSPTKHFRASFRQMAYYGYGIFKGSPNPHHVTAYEKFNPMQSMMYQVVMLLAVPVVFLTGVLLWNVKGFAGAVDLFGGVRVVATVHVLIYIFFVFFIIFHVYMGSLGHTPSAHFKAMFITGREEVDEEEAADSATVPQAAAKDEALVS
ncbi:MAG TPA: cytochrome b/b6 domain-containing protein [Burkholderiaceae bacterium]|nr:cytochrome b/b6 domain-containing protein [Burkholderiaceae bacterium]